MQKVLQSYLKRLTNLTGNNKSILLLRSSTDHFFDIHSIDFLNGKPSFHIIEQLIAQKPAVPLCPVLDSRDDKNNDVSKKIKKLKRSDDFIYEERGARDLYVGWPFVRGKFADGTFVRCPLLFFPVVLQEDNNHWVLKPREEVNVTFNKSFLLAYSYYNKVKIVDELLENSFDDIDKDSRIFRTSLYSLLKDSPVELNFNQENFMDKLVEFHNFGKTEFENSQKNGELKLYPEAVLGIFPQAGSYIVPDYVSLLEKNDFQDIEEFFESRTLNEDRPPEQHRSHNFYFLNKIKEEQTFTPFKIDAFQENALKAVKKGNSIVVHGPPGTGKSQLICNLISDFIARGKKVLVVCQKKAALDVVYKRLQENGLAEFAALVHDFKNDRKPIFNQINQQIERLYEYRFKNNSLDALQLERTFLQTSRRIDQISEELEEFKYSLYDDSECGLSVKELYLTSDPRAETINIKQEYKYFKFNTLNEFLIKLRNYTAYCAHFHKNHPWYNRRSFNGFGMNEFIRLQEVVNGAVDYQNYLQNEGEKFVQTDLKLDDYESILIKENSIRELLALLEDEISYGQFQQLFDIQDRDIDSLWLGRMEAIIMSCFNGVGPEMTLPIEQLGKFQEILHHRSVAKKSPFKWLSWVLFSKDKQLLYKSLVTNGLKDDKEGFLKLEKLVDNRLNLEHNLSQLKDKNWLTSLPEGNERAGFEKWFYHQKKALIAKLIFSSLRNFKEYFNVKTLDFPEFKSRLEGLLQLIQDIPHKKNEWLLYLTQKQLGELLNDANNHQLMLKTLKQDFEGLCEFDHLKENLEGYEEIVIQNLFHEKEISDEDTIVSLFQNSLRLAWINHLETKYPVLRSVSSIKFQRLEKELQECVKEKLKISNEILLLKAREKTYCDVEYNRLNNMITYRDLQHQVKKKKHIWPVRKIIANFSGDLFNLIPCWMASPESVSAIFPMEQLFDLVIFDEASQCYAEKGIPAMYRAQQVVITGDDKQLGPNDLYKARWEEEDPEGDAPEIEIDSLLDLAKQFLMEVQLRRHYRSKSLDLIDFSNSKYYNQNLKLLPDFDEINRKEPGIQYIKVDGVWENHINHLEAKKVAELIEKLLIQNPEKEIGVVTFNARQQDHIMDVLEEAASKRSFQIPSSLFVKNIENVQGDEKDIVIFSTAYAPDKNGKMNMQFGSLNVTRGENRLNVAITRAREKIYMITSISPHQLKVENSKNDGPRLLKEYLQYALDVSEGRYKPTLPASNSNNQDWFLKNKLKASSSRIRKEVELADELPFADLTVKSHDNYEGLIITDDDLYHQSISVKDAHVYTPLILRQKKWKFKGFFSREYWNDPDKVNEELMIFIGNGDNSQ